MKRNKYILPVLFLSGACCLPLAAQEDVPETVSSEPVRPVLELSLDKCRELAMQNNPYMQNAELDVYAARAQKQEALAEYFPKVSVNAFSFYAFNPLVEIGVTDIFGHSDFTHNLQNFVNSVAPQLGIDPVYSTMDYGVLAAATVMQPVFAGGRIVTGNRLAALGVEAATLQKNIRTRATAEETEAAYWQIVSLEEKYRSLDEVQALLDTLFSDVIAAVDAGVVTETDLLQVQIKRNELKSGKIQLLNGIRLAKMNLCNSVGVEYNPYMTIRNDSIPFIDDIRLTDSLSELLSPERYYCPEDEVAANLDETRLLDLSVESKKLEKRMALGEALPQLGVGALYGYNNFMNKGSMNGAVFAVLQIPISDWGKTSRKMQRIDYQLQKSENEREYLQTQLVLQVHKLWMDLTAAWEKLQVAEETAATAEAVERQMYDHYLAGMVTISELLQTQTQLTDARNQVLDGKIAYQTALTAYLDKTGNKR